MKKFGSRGGHVLRITAGGNAVYGAPADQRPTTAQKLGRAALTVGAGIVAAGVLGSAAGRIARAAAHAENAGKAIAKVARKAPLGKTGGLRKLEKFAVRNSYLQKALDFSHDAARYGGALAGTGAIDAGLNQTLEATDTDNEVTKVGAFAAAGAASLLVVRATEGIHLSPSSAVALRNALKKIRVPIKSPF